MKELPVWRMNTFTGVPSDFKGFTYTPGSVRPVSNAQKYQTLESLWKMTKWLDIIAYETNRTKPAKYRG